MSENENAERGSAPPVPSSFPTYQGPPVADPKFHGPLYKLMRSMMRIAPKAKGKASRKGLASNQSIHITRRKAKNY